MEISNARTAVLVDRHSLFLDALEALLARLDIRVVARTSTGDAEALAARHRPDLLIVDSTVVARAAGESNGWSALARTKRRHPSVTCIVLSDRDDADEREQAFAAGADVFCAKTARGDDLLFAVRQCFENSIYFAGTGCVARTAPAGSHDNREKRFALTKREIEILRLVANGDSNAQLAQTLWVTEQTIKFHLSNIYRKLNVANRTEAARWAHLQGLLESASADTESAAA